MVRSEFLPISISRPGQRDGDRDCTVVWIRGDQDIATKVPLVVAIARAAQRDDADVLVDLNEVTFMDASTIGAIVGSRNRLRARGQTLELRAPSVPALRLLELCGLAGLVHVTDTDAVHPAGAGAALGTWVDVLPVEPDPGAARDAARVAASKRSRVAERAFESNRAGP
jgi:anti-anti-sigma factor